MKLTRMWTRLRCRFGWHSRLDVIQTFGAAQHIGCPHCGRQFAIHHGQRAILPWDADFADLYRNCGYDIEGPLAKWQTYRRTALKEQSQ